MHPPPEKQLRTGRLVFAGGHCLDGAGSFPDAFLGHSLTAPRGGRLGMAGRPHGRFRHSVQSRQHHDASARHRHRCHKWNSNFESLRRRKASGNSGQEHRQGRVRIRVDGHRRLWKLDGCETSRYQEPRLCDVLGCGAVHDRRADDSARNTEFVGAVAGANNKTTQWRQCTIDTGSGGTEVKTSSIGIMLKRAEKMSINMLKYCSDTHENLTVTLTWREFVPPKAVFSTKPSLLLPWA